MDSRIALGASISEQRRVGLTSYGFRVITSDWR